MIFPCPYFDPWVLHYISSLLPSWGGKGWRSSDIQPGSIHFTILTSEDLGTTSVEAGEQFAICYLRLGWFTLGWYTALTWSPLPTVGAWGAHSDVHFNTGGWWNFFPGLNIWGELEWKGIVTQGWSKCSCNKRMGRGPRVLWRQNLLSVLSCSARDSAFSTQALKHTHTHVYMSK